MLKPAELNKVITLLRAGELVGLPTETVYGLAADASNPSAVQKIFAAKGRPTGHPVIVHIANAKHLTDWAINIPETAYRLAEHFWPGPLTFILKKASHVSPVITGGKKTIALRSPKHSIAQQVLNAFHGGLAAPSANRFCHISPTQSIDVTSELGNKVAHVIDGGDCDVGIESTIIDLTKEKPLIVRPGMITAKMISDCLNQTIEYSTSDEAQTPGNLETHYAPDTPVYLIDHIKSGCVLARNSCSKNTIGVISFHKKPEGYTENHWITIAKNADAYAHELYHALRLLDQKKPASILIETPPKDSDWYAIHDRLKRLSRGVWTV